MRGLRAEFIDSDRAAHGDRLVSGADIARNRFLRRSATRRDIDRFRMGNGRFIVFIALVDEGLRAVCPRVSRKRAVDIRALAETDSQPGAHRVNFARIVRRDAQSQSRDILIGCGNRAAENLGNRGIAERILRPAHTGRRIGRPRRGFSGRRDEERRIRRRRRHAPLHQIFRQRGSHRNPAVFDRRFRRILNLGERDGSRCRHPFRFFGIRAADGRIDHERFGMTLRADIVRINRAAADIGFHIVLHARIGNGCRRRRVGAFGQRESPRRDDVSGIGQCFRQADIIFHRILDLRLLILFRLAGGFGIAVFIRFQSDFLSHRLYGVLRQRIKALLHHFFNRRNELRLGLRSRRHAVLRHIGDSAAIRVNRRVFHRRRKRIFHAIHRDGRIKTQVRGIALGNPDRSRAADLREIAVRRIRHRGRCRRRAVCPAGNQSRYVIFDFIDGNSGSGCDRLHRFLLGETARNLDIVIHRRIRHDAARRHILHFGRHAIYRIIHARRRHSGEPFARLFRRADAHARRLLHAGIRRRIGNGRHILKRHAIHGCSRRLQEIVSGHAARQRHAEFRRFAFFSFFDKRRRAAVRRDMARIRRFDLRRRFIPDARHRDAGHFRNGRRLHVIPGNGARRRDIHRRICFLLRLRLFIALRIRITVGVLGHFRIRLGRCRRVFHRRFLFLALATDGHLGKLNRFFAAVAALFRLFVTDFERRAARAVLTFRILLFIRLRLVAARHTGHRAVFDRARIRRRDRKRRRRERPFVRCRIRREVFDFRFGKDIIRDDADGSADGRFFGNIRQPRFINNRRCIFGGNGDRTRRRIFARPLDGSLETRAAVDQDARIRFAAHVRNHARHADIARLRAAHSRGGRRRRIFGRQGDIAGRDLRAGRHFRLGIHIPILYRDRAAQSHFVSGRRRRGRIVIGRSVLARIATGFAASA